MGNPIINFRLSPYQLARGLQIIRSLEPDYQFSSASRIVKVIYLDYLAKMSLGKEDTVPQHYIDEIESLLYKPKETTKNLKDFTKEIVINKPDEKSIKSSVEDFSPPEDWEE